MPIQNNSGIYKILNIANGKCYVGSAESFRTRWKLHRVQLNAGKHHSQKLQRAWKKYGKDSFEFHIIEVVELSLLIDREQFWMDRLRAVKNGYNVAPTAGSALGLKRSASMRKKMVAIRQAAPLTRQQLEKMEEGRRNSPKFAAHVQHLHEKSVGRILSEHSREKIAISSKARWQDPTYRARAIANSTGRTHTPEARKKISAGKLGVPLSEKHKESLSASHKRYRPSEETRARLSAAQKARRIRERIEQETLPDSMRKKKVPGPPLTREQMQKMAEGRRKSKKFALHMDRLHALAKGRPHTEDAKKRMSDAIRFALQDPKIRGRISAAHKGRKVSEETRERMRVAAIAREARKQIARK